MTWLSSGFCRRSRLITPFIKRPRLSFSSCSCLLFLQSVSRPCCTRRCSASDTCPRSTCPVTTTSVFWLIMVSAGGDLLYIQTLTVYLYTPVSCQMSSTPGSAGCWSTPVWWIKRSTHLTPTITPPCHGMTCKPLPSSSSLWSCSFAWTTWPSGTYLSRRQTTSGRAPGVLTVIGSIFQASVQWSWTAEGLRLDFYLLKK